MFMRIVSLHKIKTCCLPFWQYKFEQKHCLPTVNKGILRRIQIIVHSKLRRGISLTLTCLSMKNAVVFDRITEFSIIRNHKINSWLPAGSNCHFDLLNKHKITVSVRL